MALPILGIITSIGSTIGNVVGSLIGFKKEQASVIQEAIKVIGDTNASNAQREQAIATIIAAEAGSGYWLAAVWRPITMIVFLGMIVAFFFGYVPPNLMVDTLPPMIAELFALLKLGIGGYIGGRTVEKIIEKVNVAAVLKKFIDKKVL